MQRFLVVVDMQTDFVDGALGTSEAVGIVDNVVSKIREDWDHVFVTYDTHFEDYMNTLEGKHLPVPHCIKGTSGWELTPKVEEAIDALDDSKVTRIEKYTFGSTDLPKIVMDAADGDDYTVTLVGLCTDICVISNALMIKAYDREKEIYVVEAATAGVTPEAKTAALTTMRSCQINIL